MFMREERLCPHNCPQSPEKCPEILLNSACRIYKKNKTKNPVVIETTGFYSGGDDRTRICDPLRVKHEKQNPAIH